MTEPKTGFAVGVWFDTDDNKGRVRAYKGTLPVVIQFEKPTPEHMTEPMVISRCPACEWSGILSRIGAARILKRWMILPP